MWLARTCSGVVYLLDVVVVGALDVGGRHVDLGAQRVDVDQQVLDLALLGNLEVVLVRVEVASTTSASDAVTWPRTLSARDA